MECSCKIENDIEDYVDLISDTTELITIKSEVIIKKITCEECGKLFSQNDKVRIVKYISDDHEYIHYTCEDCESIKEVFFDGYSYGSVLEDLTYYIDEYFTEESDIPPESCLLKLTPGAREIVFERIEDKWERYYEGYDD